MGTRRLRDRDTLRSRRQGRRVQRHRKTVESSFGLCKNSAAPEIIPKHEQAQGFTQFRSPRSIKIQLSCPNVDSCSEACDHGAHCGEVICKPDLCFPAPAKSRPKMKIRILHLPRDSEPPSVQDGFVFVFGGWNGESQFNDLFMLDVENKVVSVMASITQASTCRCKRGMHWFWLSVCALPMYLAVYLPIFHLYTYNMRTDMCVCVCTYMYRRICIKVQFRGTSGYAHARFQFSHRHTHISAYLF